jgi:hypothetical protein
MPKRKSDTGQDNDTVDVGIPTTGKKPKYTPTDEFQQVTKASFVDQYRIKDLVYGYAFYQPDVCISDSDDCESIDLTEVYRREDGWRMV